MKPAPAVEAVAVASVSVLKENIILRVNATKY